MKLRLLMGLVLFSLAGCQPVPELHKFSGAAQGTSYSVTYWTETELSQQQFEAAIASELQRLDKLVSNYRDDSVIEQFNQQLSTLPVEVGVEIAGLISTARQISEATAGCYDLTVKPLFDLWGFRNQQLNIPTSEQLAQIQPQLGMDQLAVLHDTALQKQHPELSIDLSSIAQGYSVQQLVNIAEQFGIRNYLIEIGGELQTRGAKPKGTNWRIAIERPLPGAQHLQKLVEIQQTAPLAIMTSGTYRHYYDQDGKRYSHIVDARSRAPVTHNTVSVTLLHDDLTEADAWSTALLCLGSDAGMAVAEQFGLAVLFIDQLDSRLVEKQSPALQQATGISLSSVGPG